MKKIEKGDEEEETVARGTLGKYSEYRHFCVYKFQPQASLYKETTWSSDHLDVNLPGEFLGFS